MIGIDRRSGTARAARRARANVDVRLVLRPVTEALSVSAQARAASELEAAEADALAIAEGARLEAAALLTTAERDGREAAELSVRADLAFTRRQAHEIVLSARRRTYDALRNGAFEELTRLAQSPEGQRLGERLLAVVQTKFEDTTVVRHDPDHVLSAVAESGERCATLDVTTLVDAAIRGRAREVDALWS